MAKCGFEQDLGNGMKAGIIGVAIGALGWLFYGAIKGGKSYYSTKHPAPQPQYQPRRDHRR